MAFNVPQRAGGSSKRSEPDTQTEEIGNGRPDGQKKAKRKAKEAATASTINLDSFQASLEDINDRRNNIGEQMLELMKERSEEKKRQKQQEAKMRMLSMLMAKPVLDEDVKELYLKLKNMYY